MLSKLGNVNNLKVAEILTKCWDMPQRTKQVLEQWGGFVPTTYREKKSKSKKILLQKIDLLCFLFLMSKHGLLRKKAHASFSVSSFEFDTNFDLVFVVIVVFHPVLFASMIASLTESHHSKLHFVCHLL